MQTVQIMWHLLVSTLFANRIFYQKQNKSDKIDLTPPKMDFMFQRRGKKYTEAEEKV